jgi:hypothetical protein
MLAPRIYPGGYVGQETLLGAGGVLHTWNDAEDAITWIGRTLCAYSYDGGTTWKEQVALNDPDEHIMFHEGRLKLLSDGTAVLPVYGQVASHPRPEKNPWDAYLYFSSDGGESWSPPLRLGQGTTTLSFEEPEVVELANHDLLVVMRHSNPSKVGSEEVYVNCGQTVVRKVRGRWRAGPHAMTAMGFRGHPALLRTHDGIVICAGSGNQFNFSLDDGKTWSETIRVEDPTYRRHNHYPVLVETSDGRVMSIYHLGNDWPYPPPEDQWIHATEFRVVRIPDIDH